MPAVFSVLREVRWGVVAPLLVALLATSCQSPRAEVAVDEVLQSAEEPMAVEAPASDGLTAVDDPTPTPFSCPRLDPHPVGQSIADKFDVAYEQVMTWFCDGFSFEDILLALQTSEIADIDPGTLLDRYAQIGWEPLWQELELMPVGESEQATIP